MVVIGGTALISRIQVLEHQAVKPVVIFVVEIDAQEPVFEVVDEPFVIVSRVPSVALLISGVCLKHCRMVLKEFVGIHPKYPRVGVIVDAQHPRAQNVALFVLVFSLAGITTAVREEGVPVGAEIGSVLQNVEGAVAVWRISLAAELRCHLKSCLNGEREKDVLVAHFQVTRLAVVEHSVGIPLLAACEVVLPVLVGVLSVCYVSFQV